MKQSNERLRLALEPRGGLVLAYWKPDLPEFRASGDVEPVGPERGLTENYTYEVEY